MVLYVDSSALLKRYIAEHDSDVADSFMASDPVLATSRVAEVEVRRNLARLLNDEAGGSAALRAGPETRFLTFDVRRGRAARAVGLEVVGT